MNVLLRTVGAAGLVLLLSAATVGVAFFGARSWLTLLPLATGAAGVLLALIGGGVRPALAGARARSALEAVAIAGVAFALLALVARIDVSVDVTAAKRNTLAEASAAVAKSIDDDVTVTAYVERDDRLAAELQDLVGRYRRHNERIVLRLVSPKDDPIGARAAAGAVVLRRGERTRRVVLAAGAPDQEERLTNALRAVGSDERARIYVVAGHGESEINDEGRAGLSRLARALAEEGFETVPLPLAVVGRVPEDARAVVVVGPRTQWLPAETKAIDTYLAAGGRALVLLEPGADGGLSSLLAARGVQLFDDVIVDGSAFAGLLGGSDAVAGVAYARHPVTTKLGSAMTHFQRARSLAENPGPPVKWTTLVQTGAEAWGETRLREGEAPAKDDADVGGPVTLLAAIEDESGARLIVGGDATWLSNEGLGLGANRDLVLNARLWLAAREDQIAVRARNRGGNLLLLTPSARERLAFVLLYGIPTFLVVIGAALRAARRKDASR
jgi:ABC-type uncharacterized transport system involved in gliding motility auxiliary subunit